MSDKYSWELPAVKGGRSKPSIKPSHAILLQPIELMPGVGQKYGGGKGLQDRLVRWLVCRSGSGKPPCTLIIRPVRTHTVHLGWLHIGSAIQSVIDHG